MSEKQGRTETFDDIPVKELVEIARNIRNSQWERAELLNLIEQLGFQLEVATDLNRYLAETNKELRKSLSRF